nr:MAG TPA: hypothetical protein [Caudoviricetes sp.]
MSTPQYKNFGAYALSGESVKVVNNPFYWWGISVFLIENCIGFL